MPTMLTLIERIRERLAQGAYANEAAISHGVVTPILNALGWDSADPHQLVPEYATERGRVDFALFGLGHRPAVFIEVKAVGRAAVGDRQLFEYAFHQGVPLCVLTDGREWSFYLPSGQGSYEDRRVYRLQLDDRESQECEARLTRYLGRDRVRSQRAFEDAQSDYRDIAGKREAIAILPRAWAELVAAAEDFLIDSVADKAEALCGHKPEAGAVLAYLRTLKPVGQPAPALSAAPAAASPQPATRVHEQQPASPAAPVEPSERLDRTVRFQMLGVEHSCSTASAGLVDILGVLATRVPGKLPALAEAVRTRTRTHIATTAAAIYPDHPHLVRSAVEFAPGWFIGCNLANRDKMRIIRIAADLYGITMPDDLDIALPNG